MLAFCSIILFLLSNLSRMCLHPYLLIAAAPFTDVVFSAVSDLNISASIMPLYNLVIMYIIFCQF